MIDILQPQRMSTLSPLRVLFPNWASLVARLAKNLPTVLETWVAWLGWEDPLKKGMATHSSILAWRIPWTIPWGQKESDATEPLSLSCIFSSFSRKGWRHVGDNPAFDWWDVLWKFMAPVFTNVHQVAPRSTLRKERRFWFSFSNIMLLSGISCLFLPFTSQRKVTKKKTSTSNVFHCVHCHSLIYFLCSCLQLLRIISLRCKQRHTFTRFYIVPHSSNLSYPSSSAIQLTALLPLLHF